MGMNSRNGVYLCIAFILAFILLKGKTPLLSISKVQENCSSRAAGAF